VRSRALSGYGKRVERDAELIAVQAEICCAFPTDLGMLIGKRVVATIGISILMTLAPKSAAVCVQSGPATTRVKSHDQQTSIAVDPPVARDGTFWQLRLGGHRWRSLTSAYGRRISCIAT